MIKKLITLLCITLLASCALAAQEQPSKQELNNYISTLQKGVGFTDTAYNSTILAHPTWHVDVWSGNSTRVSRSHSNYQAEPLISFYYVDNSSKGYNSIYFNKTGSLLNEVCYINMKLVRSHMGVVANDTTCVPKNETPTQVTPVVQSVEPVGVFVLEPANNTTIEPVNNSTAYDSNINIKVGNNITGSSMDFNANMKTKPTAEQSAGLIEGITNWLKYVLNI